MLLELLKERISIRKYDPRPIEREKLEAIIDAARFAPTARNRQLWEFVVVTESPMRQRLAELTDYGRFIAEASACVAVFYSNNRFYVEDGSAATTYILLAATEFGLGSCWIAGDKKEYAEDVRKLLNVPERYRLVSLISLGYPAEHIPQVKRPLNEVLHWESF
jgi:nitroreductase